MVFIKKIYQLLNKFLITEYQRLDLWYYVSFIFGITYFFQYNAYYNYYKTIIILLLTTVAIVVFFNILLLRFILLVIYFFIIAYLICSYKVSDIVIPTFQDGTIINISGEIDNIRILKHGIETTITIDEISPQVLLPRIKVNFIKDNNLLVGHKIKCKVKIYNIKRNSLPYSYDFALFSYIDKLYATGHAVTYPEIIGTNKNLNYFIYIIHQKIYYKLIKHAGKKIGNFIAAFLLGEGRAIDNNLLNTLRSSGISHVICISGLHLSLVSMLIFSTSRFILNLSNFITFRFNIKIIAASLALTCTYAYLLLSGTQIAASRAFILSAVYIFSIIFIRKMNMLRALSIAAIILLINCPAYIFHPSFQLSFAAVLALVSGFEIYNINKINNGFSILHKIKLYIFSNIYSSFLASIITAPIIIQNFYIFPTYTILNNIVAVPLMSFFLMPLSILAIFAMLINAEGVVIKSIKFFISYLIDFISYINSLPYSRYYIGYIPKTNFIIFLFGFFWLCIWQTKIRFLGIIVIIYSIISIFNLTKPDFIFDSSSSIVAVKSDFNQLKIYTIANESGVGNAKPMNKRYYSRRLRSDKITNFKAFNYKYKKRLLSSWYGQENIISMPMTKNIITSKDGYTLNINNDNENCKDVDIQINLNKHCNGRMLEINHELLNTAPLIVLYCSKSQCIIETANYNWLP